ncbi:MAG TPA: aliphatic sulfonate ABC transporter substrate-binding protein [Burkholderiaceae bacterium]|nr:aliphatic sulfonate ABC transporter substrate-binding protein [Burkholderiaceae bacterium]
MSTRAFRFLAGALSAVFVFFGSAVSTAVAAEPEVVRFGWFGGPRIWTIGKATGMFDKGLGTKVEWVQFPSGAAALTSLAAKQVDISRLGSTPTVAAIARKLPIEVFAIDGIIQTSERLIAKNPITNVAELKGKRIAYPPGSTAHYALMAALKVNNIAPKDVTLVSLTPADMVAAWKRGDIDAGYVWGPFSHTMEGDGGKEILATQALQKNGYYVWNDYVVRKEFAEKYPHIVVKFLQTYQQCVEMYNKDRDAMVKLVAQHLSQNEAAVRDTMAGLHFPSIKETVTLLGEGGPIQPAMLDTARFLVELGDLKQSEVPASFKPSVNVTYLERAMK